MTKKKDNDEIVKNMKKRQIVIILIIIFALLTVGFSIYSLITNFTFIPALIAFIIEAILSKYLNKLREKAK